MYNKHGRLFFSLLPIWPALFFRDIPSRAGWLLIVFFDDHEQPHEDDRLTEPVNII
jgi:hypothetical protein